MTWRRAPLVAAVLCVALPIHAEPDEWSAAIRAAEAAAAAWTRDNPVPHLRKALEAAERFDASDLRLLDTLTRLAKECAYEYRKCEAGEDRRYLDRALATRSQARGPEARVAEILMDLGDAARAQERYREALLCDGEALAIREKLFGPSDARVVQVHVAMAWVYQDQGDRAQARRTLQHALELRERAGVARTPEFAELVDESAKLYDAQGDEGSANREYNRAIALREQLWKPDDPRFVQALREIAWECRFRKNAAYAEHLYRRILEIQKNAHGESSEPYAAALASLGDLYQLKQRWAESEAAFEGALTIRERLLEPDLLTASWLEDLARVRLERRRIQDAIEAAERSLAIRKRVLSADDEKVLRLHALLAEAHVEAGDYQNAESCFQALAVGAPLREPWLLVKTAEKLGQKYHERGHYARSAAKLETAIATWEATWGADGWLADRLHRLAQVYRAMGRNGDADRATERANRIFWDQFSTSARGMLTPKVVLIALAIVLGAALPAAGAMGLLYYLRAKKLDHRLGALYEPPVSLPAFPAPASQRPAFHGEGADLFAIRVRNLALSLATLGVYSFWGKARIRCYLYGQVEFENDRLLFHGTGQEMLLGWLKGLPVLGFIVMFPILLPLIWQHRYSAPAGQIGAVVLFILLWPVARAGAYRYRLNRMSWRGVRFSFRGGTFTFLLLCLRGYLLTLLTLGLYLPAFDVRIRRFLFDQTFFGDSPFRFSGRGRHLIANYILAIPLTVLTFGLFWAWWSAVRHRYYWAHTTFAGARFRCTVTGSKLLWLWIGNFLLWVPTLGLGGSWAVARTFRFWTRNIELAGEPDLAAIRQDARATSALGESFADFLGFDFGV